MPGTTAFGIIFAFMDSGIVIGIIFNLKFSITTLKVLFPPYSSIE